VAEDQRFELLPSWGLRHVGSGLCAFAGSAAEGTRLSLSTCDPKDARQRLKNDYTTIRNSLQELTLEAGNSRFHLAGGFDGSVFLAAKRSADRLPRQVQSWDSWSFFPNTGQLRNQYDPNESMGYPRCLSTCKPTGSLPIVV